MSNIIEVCPNCKSIDVFKNKENKFICGDCLTKFDSLNLAQNETLNIFISYGHPENKICKMIYNALKQRGHNVWFDEEKIKPGDNWRQKIAEGILNSNGVVACLSEHSTRERGVCLDELSIAVGIKGCNINTILLDSENKVLPPASICHIQWLDMHDWKERLEENEQKFNEWFENKMQELFSILESEENKKFSGQIDLISKTLDVCYETSKQKELLNKTFVGRRWLTQEIENWLDSKNDSKFCVLYGEPGIGKSAFSAHYIHYNSRVAAGIFCDYKQSLYSNPKIIIQTLAYLLACRFPNYRDVLTDILLDKEIILKLNENELFEFLLVKPLTEATIDGGRETMCIVIDGLDEAGNSDYNVLAETLAKYVPRLPKWLKVLVTSRKISAVNSVLTNAETIEIIPNSANNICDIEEYFKIKLSQKYYNIEDYDMEIKLLSEKSDGIFLYANMVADAILQDKISIKNTNEFPTGLESVFCSWFGWFFEDYQEYINVFRLPLGTILASETPIPVGELRRIFDFDINKLNDFLRRIEVLLRIDKNAFKEKTLEFSHKYLADWLDSKASGRFQTSKIAAKEIMADKYYEMFLKDINLLSRFEILNIAKLLNQLGRKEEYKDVIQNDTLYWKINKIADEYIELGKLKEAKQCFYDMINMAKFQISNKNDENARKKLAYALNNLGNLLRKEGKIDEGIKFYYDSLKIKENIVKENDSAENIRDLYISYNQIGDILRIINDMTNAELSYIKANSTIKQVYEHTKTIEDKRTLAVSYSQLGDFYKFTNNYEKAFENLLKSKVLIEEITKDDNNLKYKRDLAVSYVQLGLLYIDKEKYKSKEYFEIAHEIFKELYDCLKDEKSKRDLAISHERLAEVKYYKENDKLISNNLYRSANNFFRELIEENDKPEYLRDLAFCKLLQAEKLIQTDEFVQALEIQNEVHSLIEKLNIQRGTAEDKRDLAVSYGMLGYIYYNCKDIQKALEMFDKSNNTFKDLLRERGTIEDKRDLNITQKHIESIKNSNNVVEDLLWEKKIKRRCWYTK